MFNLFRKVPSLDIKEMDKIKNKHRIIDVRTAKEVSRFGKIKGIRNIASDELLENPQKHLDQEKEYYLLCQSGIRSKKTVKKLNAQGYNTINLKGGYYLYTRT